MRAMPSLGQCRALSLAGEVPGGNAIDRSDEALSMQVVQIDRARAMAHLCGSATKQIAGRMKAGTVLQISLKCDKNCRLDYCVSLSELE